MTAELRSRPAGVTLLELIVIIAVIGILALVATVLFAGVQGFVSRGFYDKAFSTVRLAQKTAVAWRRAVFVCVTTNQIAASTVAGCATPLTNSTSGAPAVETAPSGVTMNTVSFSFDSMGRASADTTITFTSTIAGDPARQIAVTAETGYVAAN